MPGSAFGECILSDLKSLGERIRLAAQRVGGNEALSEKTGIPLRTIGNYIAGTNEIKALALHRIAIASDLSSEWLLTGDFEDFATQSAKKITPEIIESAVGALYQHLETHHRQMDSKSFGEAAAILCDLCASKGGFDPNLLDRLTRLKGR